MAAPFPLPGGAPPLVEPLIPPQPLTLSGRAHRTGCSRWVGRPFHRPGLSRGSTTDALARAAPRRDTAEGRAGPTRSGGIHLPQPLSSAGRGVQPPQHPDELHPRPVTNPRPETEQRQGFITSALPTRRTSCPSLPRKCPQGFSPSRPSRFAVAFGQP